MVLSEEKEWQMPHVHQRLVAMGVPKQHIQDLAHRVESAFFERAHHMGARCEWSVQWGELTGDFEDVQFDLDRLREEAITDVAEHWRDWI
jgi:hypothetical protein